MADAAPRLLSGVGEIWPRADRQHFAVHRSRNLRAKLTRSEHDRIGFNDWSALTDATSVKDGKLPLQVLISKPEHAGYQAAARCLAGDLDVLVVPCATRSDTENGGGQRMNVSRACDGLG